jgi:hypothetical protein
VPDTFYSTVNHMPSFPLLHQLCLLPTYPNLFLSKTEWWSYFIHLRNLNIIHFVMVKAKGLKHMASRHLEWHHLPTKFYEINQSVQKLLGGHTDRLVILQACFYFGWSPHRICCPASGSCWYSNSVIVGAVTDALHRAPVYQFQSITRSVRRWRWQQHEVTCSSVMASAVRTSMLCKAMTWCLTVPITSSQIQCPVKRPKTGPLSVSRCTSTTSNVKMSHYAMHAPRGEEL